MSELPSMPFPLMARLEERPGTGWNEDLGVIEDQYDCVLYVGQAEFFRCPADQYLAGFGRTERGKDVDATLADALSTVLDRLGVSAARAS